MDRSGQWWTCSCGNLEDDKLAFDSDDEKQLCT